MNQSNPKIAQLVLSLLIGCSANAGENLDAALPIRGFCIAAPGPKSLDAFIRFVQDELAPRNVNALILRVDYRFAYESHPELRDSEVLSKEAAKRLVTVCRT